MQQNFLQISRADFVRETKAFNQRGVLLAPHAYLKFEHGKMIIECGCVRIALPAKGHWPGIAKTSWTVVKSIIAVPPTNDPIPISYAQNTLMIGFLSAQCRWLSTGTTSSAAPSGGLSLARLIILDRSINRQEAHLRGLTDQLRGARLQYRNRLRKDSEALAPFGISETEIRILIESKIAAHAEK